MNQAEYDKMYRKAGQKVSEEEPVQPMMEADGAAMPLNLKIVNSTPQERHEKEMKRLHEGGADYSGNEQWRHFMRRMGRSR